MNSYDPAAYGDALSAEYDDLYPADDLETEEAVALVADLAEPRPARAVVEFGIGTGRLALALGQRGLRVAGIEGSRRMLEALRAKPGGDEIHVEIGDYASACVPGRFSVVLITFNTILDPRGLDALLAIFANARRHLEPRGCLVVEAFVLDDAARSGSWTVRPRYVGDRHVELELARFNIDSNCVERTLVHLRREGPRFVSVTDYYAGPGELDVMAHVHGMRRIARYADWRRRPFTAASTRHVTVYELH